MVYYIQNPDSSTEGPFTQSELADRYRQGGITLETPIQSDHPNQTVPYRALCHGRSPSRSRGLLPFLWPFNELHRLADLDHRGLLSLIGVGLVPMVLFTLFIGVMSQPMVFFLTALYFSVLWAILFYHVFPAPHIKIGTSIFCFLGTGLVSVSLLMGFFRLPLISFPTAWIGSDLPAIRAMAFFVWVAIPEELCKILMIYVLSKRAEGYRPRTMAYYGMICGLGFGIYEGLDYQLDRNVQFAQSQTEYLFLNLLRLTSLPVLHAVWTGVAGYWLGFASLYPKRRIVLFLVGIGIPSLLHALFNTFSGTLTSLGISLLSVLILILYLSKHDRFDRYLRGEEDRPPTT